MVLDHESSFQPVSSLLLIIERVLSNIVTCRSLSRSFIIFDVSVRVSRVWEVNTGQHDRTLLMLQFRGDHSLAGIFCPADLLLFFFICCSIKSRVRASCVHNAIPKSQCLLVSMLHKEVARPIWILHSLSFRGSSNLSLS